MGSLLLLVFGAGCHSNHDEGIDQRSIPYSLDNLRHATPYQSAEPFSFTKRFVLVSYYHNLDCNTCVNRELAQVQEFHKRYKEKLDFILVAFSPLPKGVSGNSDLRNLRRVGRVAYPIYTEHEKGACRLGERFTISILDTHEQTIILRYFPVTSIDRWPEFEQLAKFKLANAGLQLY